MPDGKILEAYYEKDKKDGKAILRYPNGTVEPQLYRDGKLIPPEQ